ncbi:CAP domain-containing protein [Ruegeria sp. AU67]|uniref:CAP domain-containing protein n=1 Tax=Ruegeria sp. AU67 TaxID=2108530 RepID=UPI00190F9565|nr:CAP domain-containing protein [Ruegeria sp. AU67]
MLGLINAEREKVGAPPLALELNLNEASEDHSKWMIATDIFSHTGVNSSSAGKRMADAGFDFSGGFGWAENIAARSIRAPDGFDDEVIGLHNQLMNSAGHRANLLNPDYDYIGIGIEIGEYQGNTWAFVTQNFARTGGSVSLDTGSDGGTPLSNQPSAALPDNPRDLSDRTEALEYIASYDDLIAAFGANAEAGLRHYTDHGYLEQRQVTFDGLEYIASHNDLIRAFRADAEAGANHFIFHGRTEGRESTFDGLEYIASHVDLINAFGANSEAGSTHYITHGLREGRSKDTFDAETYLDNYTDLQAAFGNDLESATEHFIAYGYSEGRSDDFLF